MEYTVQQLAELAGISARTLRYYDQIGLLKPARINDSGYRIYGGEEIDLLQQILFYKALGFSLEEIKNVVTATDFHRLTALENQREQLLIKREQLDLMLANLEKSIAAQKGEIKMTAREKFEGLKHEMISANEKEFGQEVREKYGDEAMDSANAKLSGLSKEKFDEMQALEKELKELLARAMKTEDPAGELAQRVAALHKKWLLFFWSEYSKEAHAGLAHMYVQDPRFKAYYDEIEPGAAKFLRDAIVVFTQE